MPLTITITQELKDWVDTYLLNNNPEMEKGGFLLGKDYTLMIPRFFPNISDTPQTSYLIAQNWRSFLDYDLKFFQMNFICFFHTHPHHIIPSEVDMKLDYSIFKSEIVLLIMFDQSRKTFTWRAFKQGGEEQYIEIINKNYPVFQQYFAQTLNLLNLGSCFVTPKGEFLCNNQLGNAFIMIDMDAVNLYNLIIKQKGYLTKSKMKEILQFSDIRLNKVIEKLKKNGLMK